MSLRVIQQGRRSACYRVCYNADNYGQAPHLLLRPQDFWVGSDYWAYVEELQPSYLDRILAVMRYYEQHNKQADNYKRAQKLASNYLQKGKP